MSLITLMNWVDENSLTVTLTSVLLLMFGIVVSVYLWDRRSSIKKYLEHRREVRIQRGIAMGRKQKADRQAYVKGLLGDVITNGLEEAWFAGKISEEERNACYRMIGKTHGIPDLLPHMTPAALKSLIKGRRSRGIASPAQENPAWGDNPSKKDDPPSKTATVINATKRFGEKALSRLKNTA